jgi:hypothetical protein
MNTNPNKPQNAAEMTELDDSELDGVTGGRGGGWKRRNTVGVTDPNPQDPPGASF